MKLIVKLVLSFLVASSALAQSALVITSIEPSKGSSRGGTPVVLTGSGFNTTIQCIVPCPTKVAFDKAEVVPAEMSDTRMVVIAPAHAAGAVDVTVKTGDGRSTTVAGAFTYEASLEAQFTPILLPVYTDGRVPGANGSMWQTDLWIRNSGTENIELAPWVCPPGQACPAVFPYRHTLVPGGTIHNLPAAFRPPTANPSRVIFATRDQGDRLSLQLRNADVTRSTLNAGTEIPVVRERDLLASPADLLNVPFDTSFRVMLRIYDVANTTSRFRVSLVAQTDTATTVEHAFEIEATTTDTGEFRSTAAYGQFNLEDLRVMKRVWPTALRLRIEPLTPGSRFWAFASVTNNETQLVTLVSPQ